jgi:hypothetical protein
VKYNANSSICGRASSPLSAALTGAKPQRDVDCSPGENVRLLLEQVNEEQSLEKTYHPAMA